MEPAGERFHIVADHRERASGVLEYLRELPCVQLEMRQLAIADFLLGGDVAVERKSARDLVASVIDRRLFTQAEELLAAFKRPLLLIEGDPFAEPAGIRPNAIRGALARIAAMYRLPVLTTAGPEATALLLLSIARQAQSGEPERPRAGQKRRAVTLAARQRAVVEGLPGVGPVLADRLLRQTGSIERLARADVATLRSVEGIGPRRAEAMKTLLTGAYCPTRSPEQLAQEEHETSGSAQLSADFGEALT